MSCPYEVNDGAYILGALAPAERAEFEQHLATCPSCRESVAALAVLPGLLGRLDPATLAPSATLASSSVTSPPELLPRVLSAARSRRRAAHRRQLLTTAVACVATAVLATGVAVGANLIAGRGDTAVIVTPEAVVFTEMEPGSGYAPVVAEIGIRPEPTGTTVSVRCLYHGQGHSSWPIWLVVYPRGESEAEAIGSWVASPGAEINVTATTHLTPAQIARIELQGSDHATIAWWSP